MLLAAGELCAVCWDDGFERCDHPVQAESTGCVFQVCRVTGTDREWQREWQRLSKSECACTDQLSALQMRG